VQTAEVDEGNFLSRQCKNRLLALGCVVVELYIVYVFLYLEIHTYCVEGLLELNLEP